MPARLQRIETFYQPESSFIDSLIHSTNMNKNMNMATLGSAQSSKDERTRGSKTTFKRFGATVNAEFTGTEAEHRGNREHVGARHPEHWKTRGRTVMDPGWGALRLA